MFVLLYFHLPYCNLILLLLFLIYYLFPLAYLVASVPFSCYLQELALLFLIQTF